MPTLSCYHAVKRVSASEGRPPIAPLYTDIAFVGDRSGSMSSTRGGSQTGARDYMKKQREAAERLCCYLGYFVDFTTFDSEIECPFSGDAIEINDAVLQLMQQAMVPRGSTRLYDTIIDSICRQIKRLEKKFKEMPLEVQFLVQDQPWLFAASCSPMTDGQDNTSAEGAQGECKTVLEDYQRKYCATAMVLAANQDAANLAETLGLNRDSGLQMGTTGDECMAAMSSAAAAQLRSATSGGLPPPSLFTQLERETSYTQDVHVQSCPATFAGLSLHRTSARGSSTFNLPPEHLRVNANVIIPPPPPPPRL